MYSLCIMLVCRLLILPGHLTHFHLYDNNSYNYSVLIDLSLNLLVIVRGAASNCTEIRTAPNVSIIQ